MEIRNWALIIFTILAQMSVGAFVVLGIMHFFAARKAGMEEADRLSDRALIAIFITLVLGLIASLFHLGSPFKAYVAVSNLGSSWLSREVFSGVLFAVFGFLFTILQWRKIGTFTLRNIIAWVAALIGLTLVYFMSRIYRLEIQPAWNTWFTTLLFYVTTFLLGSLAIGVALVTNYAALKRQEPECVEVQCKLMDQTMRWIALTSIVLLGIELVAISMKTVYLAGSSIPQAVDSIVMTYTEYGLLFALSLILVFLGAGVFALFIYRNAFSPEREQVMSYFIVGAFVLVLAAEVIGRYLFYATQVSIGI